MSFAFLAISLITLTDKLKLKAKNLELSFFCSLILCVVYLPI